MLRLKVFTPNEKSVDRSREPPGIVAIRFQLARSPDELFKWHWAVPPANRLLMENPGLRLAHGWKLDAGRVAPPSLIREFIRPAVSGRRLERYGGASFAGTLALHAL